MQLPICRNTTVRARVRGTVSGLQSEYARARSTGCAESTGDGRQLHKKPHKKPHWKVESKNDSNFYFFVVVLNNTKDPNETGTSRIRGLEVRAMTGEVVPTLRTRGRTAAWFIFQREEPTPHRRCRHAQVIFPRQQPQHPTPHRRCR